MIEAYDYEFYVISNIFYEQNMFSTTIAHRNKLLFYSNDCAFYYANNYANNYAQVNALT